VDVVVVPASVQDSAGKLVAGLVREDFRVFEDGQPQSISNFSVDPQPLSAAIVIDTGMSGIALRRLAPLFISVTGGFSEFDEMCSLRYDHLVHRLSDFTKDPVQIEKSLDVVKTIAEKQPAQVPGGDAAPTAPKIVQLLLQLIGGGGGISPGGPPPDPSKPPTTQRKTGPGSVRTSRVLFDAVFEAAKVLEGRPAHHRKIIFIISDGQVAGTNTHNLGDTTALLLRQEIQVYAVTTDLGAFEGRFGVLGTYAELTGGDV
jgi:VWFA-related protein